MTRVRVILLCLEPDRLRSGSQTNGKRRETLESITLGLGAGRKYMQRIGTNCLFMKLI